MAQRLDLTTTTQHGKGDSAGTPVPVLDNTQGFMTRAQLASVSPLLARWLKTASTLRRFRQIWDDSESWGGWLPKAMNLMTREESGIALPYAWERAFQTQLENWRATGKDMLSKLRPETSHGLWPPTTWVFAYLLLDSASGRPTERLMLACMPPGVCPQDRMALGLWYPETVFSRDPSIPDSTITVSGQAIRLDEMQVEDLAWGALREGAAWIASPLQAIGRNASGSEGKKGRRSS